MLQFSPIATVPPQRPKPSQFEEVHAPDRGHSWYSLVSKGSVTRCQPPEGEPKTTDLLLEGEAADPPGRNEGRPWVQSLGVLWLALAGLPRQGCDNFRFWGTSLLTRHLQLERTKPAPLGNGAEDYGAHNKTPCEETQGVQVHVSR